MSLRLEMLQVARIAPKMLGEATDLVRQFVQGQFNEDGGCKDRTGQSDLYYTVFGIDSLLALQCDLPHERLAAYLHGFGPGENLDFVHLCCLARAWSALSSKSEPLPHLCVALLQRVEQFRTPDGGYHPLPNSRSGTVYGGFLALGAYQDLRRDLPDPMRLVQSLKLLETQDGAWSNDPNLKIGSTNATAAAVTILRQFNLPVNSSVGAWLMAQAHPQGGFRAAPNAPIPDLLSTATGLHALAGLEHDFGAIRENCLDFVDSLWTNEGSFHGHWAEDVLDVEYTFYGLLALGHLGVTG